MSEQSSEDGKISEIIAEINKLNLGQVSKLINKIKEEHNIKEDAMVQMNTVSQVSEKTEEKSSSVSVKLIDIGSQKVLIYKIIGAANKELKGKDTNLIEAKKLAESAEGIILENIPTDKAEEFKKQLEEKGAKAEIK